MKPSIFLAQAQQFIGPPPTATPTAAEAQPPLSGVAGSPAATTTAPANTGTAQQAPAKPSPQQIVIPRESLPIVFGIVVALAAATYAVTRYLARRHERTAGERSNSRPEGVFRNEIAQMLLNTSVWGLIIIGASLILLSSAGVEGFEKAKGIFDALLPVFGTWVGTLLAFYFSRENFEAATKSVTEMAKGVSGLDKLGTIFVRDKMIRADQIATLPPKWQGQDDAKIPLKPIVEHLAGLNLDRLPLFEGNKPNGRARYVVHVSNIHRFLAERQLAQIPSPAPPAAPASGGTGTPAPVPATGSAAPAAPPQSGSVSQPTLADLVADSKLAAVFRRSFTCVAETCTLADAKVAMDVQSKSLQPLGNCYDVFITAKGSEAEPVIGWITNDIINENAKV